MAENRYLDFHLHAFPDIIASKAIACLERICGVKALTNGTIEGLKGNLKEWGVKEGVLMPIATNPAQQESVNNWAAKVQSEGQGIYAFGSIHPDSLNKEEAVKGLKELGLKGIKLHPDYQEFFIKDTRMEPVYRVAEALNLPILFHMGYDPMSPELVHGRPEEVVWLAEAYPELKVICAHLGGGKCAETWRNLEIPGNIYMDTALMAAYFSKDEVKYMLEKLGTERLLLASDCPWSSVLSQIEMLEGLGLTEEELSRIYYRNGAGLLGLE